MISLEKNTHLVIINRDVNNSKIMLKIMLGIYNKNLGDFLDKIHKELG